MREQGVYTVFKGYIDESYNPNYFALSCLFGKSLNWSFFVQDWKSIISDKNRELQKQDRPPITRFHASDCSTGFGEFKGWTSGERIEFTKSLLRVFDKPSNALTVSSYTISLTDLTETFPEAAIDPKGFAYSLLMKFVMLELGTMFAEANDGDTADIKMTLIHERCAYNGVLQTAFNEMSQDATFRFKHIFTSLAPLGWEECPNLQPADLIAYENCKEADRRGLRPEMDMRRSLQYLLSPDSRFSGRSKGFTKENIQQLKALMDGATTKALKAQAEGLTT